MSSNLVLTTWSNRGLNLWEVDLQSQPLSQGVSTYYPPANTVALLDLYVRTFSLNTPANLAPACVTTLGSSIVAITIPANGLTVGAWINIVVPISVGGLVLLGFYQVTSTPSPNTFTIAAASSALSGDSGGAVPVFTTTAGSPNVSVALALNGFLPGQSFVVQVSTYVGGLTLSGSYVIQSITDSGNFVIATPYTATANETLAENGGLASFALQTMSVDPQDRPITQIGRTEYANQPDKFVQAPPTVVWFDRTIQPTITVWQVPDANGPYVLQYYRMRETQDFNIKTKETLDAPRRFYMAFVSEVALDMWYKYPPPPERGITLKDMRDRAKEQWDLAMGEDTEKPYAMHLRPNFTSYFN